MKFLSYLRKQTGATPLIILEVLGIAGVVVATSYYITTVAVNKTTTESSQAIEEVKDGGLAEGSVSLDKLSDSVFLTGTTNSGDITSATIQDAIVTVGSLDKNIFTITYPDNTTAKVSIGEGKITDFHLKDGSITTVKILDNAVTTAKLQDGSVTTVKILDGTITAGKLANGAVTTQNIQDGAITSSKLQDGAVTSSTLQDNAITTSKLTDQAVTAAKIATGTITGSQVASDGSITKSLTAGDGITVTNNNNGTFTITNSRIDAWQRTASTSTLQPTTANDNINLGSGNYLTTGSFNHLSLNTNSTGDGFNITGGNSNSRTLTINGNNVTLNQSLQTTDTPTFASLTIDTLTGMLKATNGTLAVATADTDYQRPITWSNGLTYTTGTAGIDYNTTNLKLTSGSLDTIQDITTDATPTFSSVQTTTSITLQDPGSGTNTITMQAPTLSTDYTLTLPTTNGNNGEYLKTDGDGNLSWATSATNQLVQSFTAATGESITAGDVVSLMNGEVKKGINAVLGSDAVANSTTMSTGLGTKAAKLDDTHFVMVYANSTTYNVYAIIGEVNGNTITYGAESLVSTSGYGGDGHLSVIGLSATRFIVFSYDRLVAGAVSGTTITGYGTEVVGNTTLGNSNSRSVTVLDSTHFVASWYGSSNFYSQIGILTDTTISYGTPSSSVTSSNYPTISALDANRFIIFHTYNGLSITIGMRNSNNSITYGTTSSLGIATTPYYSSITCSDSSHFIIKYIDQNIAGYLVAGTVSGLNLSGYGVPKNYASGNVMYGSLSALNSTNFIVTYVNGDTAAVYMREYYFNDLTINEVSDVPTALGVGAGNGSIIKLNQTTQLFSYNPSPDFYPVAKASNIGIPLGIAKTSATGGNDVDVILSGVSDNFSGLTVGTAYYFDTNGQLTTTVGSNKAGVAISTTELLLDYTSMGADQFFNDIVFNNDFRITEATDYAGLIFKNQLGYEILNMQENGDLNVSNSISAQSLAISGDTVITGNTSVSGSMTLDNISPTTSLNISLGTDAGDDLIVGNNNTFVVKGDTDKVGIGTSTPTAKLDITTQDTNDTTGLVVNQQDLDQIAMQLSSSTNATATMFDLATNNTSGNLINLDWDTTTQASGNIIGTNLDYTNLTPTNDSSNYLYGIHLDNPVTNNDSNAYAIYIEGTAWDKGLVSDSPIQTNSSFILQDSNSQTNTITVKSPTLASSYTLTLPTTAGITGQYLTTDGEGNLEWSDSGTYKKILDQTNNNADTQTIDLPIILANYDYIELQMDIVNNSDSLANYKVYFNNDLEATNYYAQIMNLDKNVGDSASSVLGYSVNDALVGQVKSRKYGSWMMQIKTGIDGKTHGESTYTDDDELGKGNITKMLYTVSTDINNIKITCDQATGIGKGSKFTIYGLKK